MSYYEYWKVSKIGSHMGKNMSDFMNAASDAIAFKMIENAEIAAARRAFFSAEPGSAERDRARDEFLQRLITKEIWYYSWYAVSVLDLESMEFGRKYGEAMDVLTGGKLDGGIQSPAAGLFEAYVESTKEYFDFEGKSDPLELLAVIVKGGEKARSFTGPHYEIYELMRNYGEFDRAGQLDVFYPDEQSFALFMIHRGYSLEPQTLEQAYQGYEDLAAAVGEERLLAIASELRVAEKNQWAMITSSPDLLDTVESPLGMCLRLLGDEGPEEYLWSILARDYAGEVDGNVDFTVPAKLRDELYREYGKDVVLKQVETVRSWSHESKTGTYSAQRVLDEVRGRWVLQEKALVDRLKRIASGESPDSSVSLADLRREYNLLRNYAKTKVYGFPDTDDEYLRMNLEETYKSSLETYPHFEDAPEEQIALYAAEERLKRLRRDVTRSEELAQFPREQALAEIEDLEDRLPDLRNAWQREKADLGSRAPWEPSEEERKPRPTLSAKEVRRMKEEAREKNEKKREERAEEYAANRVADLKNDAKNLKFEQLGGLKQSALNIYADYKFYRLPFVDDEREAAGLNKQIEHYEDRYREFPYIDPLRLEIFAYNNAIDRAKVQLKINNPNTIRDAELEIEWLTTKRERARTQLETRSERDASNDPPRPLMGRDRKVAKNFAKLVYHEYAKEMVPVRLRSKRNEIEAALQRTAFLADIPQAQLKLLAAEAMLQELKPRLNSLAPGARRDAVVAEIQHYEVELLILEKRWKAIIAGEVGADAKPLDLGALFVQSEASKVSQLKNDDSGRTGSRRESKRSDSVSGEEVVRRHDVVAEVVNPDLGARELDAFLNALEIARKADLSKLSELNQERASLGIQPINTFDQASRLVMLAGGSWDRFARNGDSDDFNDARGAFSKIQSIAPGYYEAFKEALPFVFERYSPNQPQRTPIADVQTARLESGTLERFQAVEWLASEERYDLIRDLHRAEDDLWSQEVMVGQQKQRQELPEKSLKRFQEKIDSRREKVESVRQALDALDAAQVETL